jgi:molecular chaperone HtpG
MVKKSKIKTPDWILKGKEEEKTSKVKQLTDLAMLSQGMLKGEELTNFIERSIDFI